MSTLNSPFSSLWIDQADQGNKLQEIEEQYGSEVVNNLQGFIEKGFMILRGVIADKEIAAYKKSLDAALTSRRDLKISFGSEIRTNDQFDVNTPLTKVLDTHVLFETAPSLFFNKEVYKYLQIIFDAPPLAFQSLYFNVGSTQAIHQDTAYVVINQPLNLAASWIALEDVVEGAGELEYIPGSHRFADFLYANHFRHWSPERDGNALHDHHLHWLREYAQQNGYEVQKFLPKRGDALIWHADLAHGGAPITLPNKSRKSLVTHYCGARSTPHYFQYLPVERQFKRPCLDGYISSFYYEKVDFFKD